MISFLEPSRASRILTPLASWFDRNKRSLPWRATNLKSKHRDPYAVLVSEFMLQQTQVNTVVPYFERWMKRFPNLKKLANSSPDTVMKYWEGLGYYQRCRNLHNSCQWIAKNGWPKTRDEMLALPGIGTYTSAAIGSIAFQWPTPALDGNVIRLLSRLHAKDLKNKKQMQAMEVWLQPALDSLGPSRLTQALMEFGSLVCKKSQPQCMSCPLSTNCQAYQLDLIHRFPKTKRKGTRKVKHHALLIIVRGDQVLLEKPSPKRLLGNLYCFPTSTLGANERFGTPYIHHYSHLTEHIYPLLIRVSNVNVSSPYCWVRQKELSHFPLGNRDKSMLKIIASLQEKKNIARSLTSKMNKTIFKQPISFRPI